MVGMSSLSRRICSKRLHRSLFHHAPPTINVNNFAWTKTKTKSRNSSSNAAGDPAVSRDPIKVAFVGLGNMGLRMALNLAKEPNDDDGLPPMHLAVHDLQESNVSRFFEHAERQTEAEAGLQRAGVRSTTTTLSAVGDLSSVGESSPDFVVSSLPTCEASEAVVGDIVQSLPAATRSDDANNDDDDDGKKCIFIDTSTIGPNVSKSLHRLVTSVSPRHDYVDAPVSGGVKGATDATLTFMVGCPSDSETFSAIRPLLRRMGKGAIPCGEAGSGSAVKLCNNAALAAQMVGICEAMNLGDALGVDPTVLAGAMNVSTAKCWSSEVNNPHPSVAEEMGSGASAHGYDGGFGTALMLKDLNLAVDAGVDEGLALPVAGLSRDLYRMAALHGYGDRDFGVMLEFLKGVKK